MKMILSCLVVLCIWLTGCIAVPPTPADTGTATEEIAPAGEATEELLAEVAPTDELASTAEITSTEGMTPSVSVPFAAIQNIVDFAPGAWTPPHSHGGLVLVTILEGEVTERDEVTGEETVYGPGEFWTEEAGHLHAAGNDGQENVRLAVVTLLPEGASATTVEDGTSTDDLPPGPTPVYRTSMPVTESLGNFEAIQNIVDFAPGAWTPPHSHGGLVLVTILEGEVTERDGVTAEETVYGPGEFWTEEAGHLHAAGNDGQENVRLAVVTLLPEGASATTVEDGTSTDDLPPGPTPVYRTSMPVTTATE